MLCDISNKLINSPNDGIVNASLQNFVMDINKQNMQAFQNQAERE